jgi:hypothetical protein
MAIESVRVFCHFCKIQLLKNLRSQNFFKFRDKGLSGCSEVVAVCE